MTINSPSYLLREQLTLQMCDSIFMIGVSRFVILLQLMIETVDVWLYYSEMLE
jgi:hypothetical protein